jgi:hypothetical protein
MDRRDGSPQRNAVTSRAVRVLWYVTFLLLTGFFAQRMLHAVNYYVLTHDPNRPVVTATVTRCGGAACTARCVFEGRTYEVASVQRRLFGVPIGAGHRPGDHLTYLVQHEDPYRFHEIDSPQSVYAPLVPLVAVGLLTPPIAIVWLLNRRRRRRGTRLPVS